MTDAAATVPYEPEDIRPVVPRGDSGNFGLWAAGGALLLGGWLVFSMMDARREAVTAPRTAAIPGSEAGRILSPPPLALPGYGNDPLYYDERYPVLLRRVPRAPAPVGTAPVIRTAPAPRVAAPVTYPPATVRPIEPAPSYETPRQLPERQDNPLTANASERVKAGRLASPSLTVPQGTVIPAVLETALDSTRPGAARALVQRNVYGFDGTRVLIPRGSRLYGEYEADLGSGQKRAGVKWTRLLRPDGVTIALDSPASDPLGRAGVKGKVDSKFLQRFGGALLQSVLDVGVGVATRRATDGVIVALPGSTQNLNVTDPAAIKPTLTVKQGTSVSVFVARDLDFSGVDY